MTRIDRFEKYVEIPWSCGKSSLDEADCWGLVTLVLRNEFDIHISHMQNAYITDRSKISKAMLEGRNLSGWKITESPQAGDVCMMYVASNEAPKGRPEHVGVMIDSLSVLHSFSRSGGLSAIHETHVLKRMFKKLEFYHYAPD